MTIKIGILKETKTPPDKRVAVTPNYAKELSNKFLNLEIKVQSSNYRAIKDNEFIEKGISVVDDISDCEILIGVKEVAIPTLIPNKTYIYFSHTAKKQKHNQKLLQEMARLKITLLDHEYFTDTNNMRLVAFGKWAGIVGAYNGLIAYGRKTGLYQLKRAFECFDFKDMLKQVEKVKLPPIKILITGGGRVAYGALETLSQLKLQMVSPNDFLTKQYNEPVICRIDPSDYTKRKDGNDFDFNHFINNPSDYISTFKPYTKVTDLYIPCHFWDPKSPNFMTKNDYLESGFNIKVISDVSCDMEGPIPSTLRSSTIAEPFYGYNPTSSKEDIPFKEGNVAVCAIDNLPGELPRDASEEFSKALAEHVIPRFATNDIDGVLERATILKNGKLTQKYSYLQDFLDGNE